MEIYFDLAIVFVGGLFLLLGTAVLVALLIALILRITEWVEARRDLRTLAERFEHHQRRIS